MVYVAQCFEFTIIERFKEFADIVMWLITISTNPKNRLNTIKNQVLIVMLHQQLRILISL
jgi:hypothetical protein